MSTVVGTLLMLGAVTGLAVAETRGPWWLGGGGARAGPGLSAARGAAGVAAPLGDGLQRRRNWWACASVSWVPPRPARPAAIRSWTSAGL